MIVVRTAKGGTDVDRAVSRIGDTLARSGELGNTYIVFLVGACSGAEYRAIEEEGTQAEYARWVRSALD